MGNLAIEMEKETKTRLKKNIMNDEPDIFIWVEINHEKIGP